MPTYAANLPSAESAEYAEAERRKAYADALMQQSMSPAPVQSWTQVLAQVMKGGMAGKERGEAEKKQKDIVEGVGNDRRAALADALRLAQGTPAQPAQMQEDAAGIHQMDAMPARAANPMAAYERLSQSLDPQLQMAGMQGAFGQMAKANEQYTLPEGAIRIGPDGRVIRENPKDFKPETPKGFKAGDTRTVINGENNIVQEYQQDGTWKNIGEGPRFARSVAPIVNNTTPAAVTPVTVQDPKDPNKTIVVDGRTGRVIGAGPKLTDTGKQESKRQFNMQGIGGIIAEAESLLTNPAKPPTGSGIGNVYDKAAGFFGKTPAGAAEAEKLRAVGGALVSKMPRMEGPQSDRDVALYKEMAGMVGDASIPVARRVAALDEVKKLWSKYERLNPDAFASDKAPGGAPAPAPAPAPGKPRVVDW